MTYKFYPKRPIKSFQDLEVYQKLHNISVMVIKRINPSLSLRGEILRCHCEEPQATKQSLTMTAQDKLRNLNQMRLPRPFGARNDIMEKLITNLTDTLLSLPILLATAHSLRFSNQNEAIAKLEEAMLKCNLAVVYLEQYRDLGYPAAEVARPLESQSLPSVAEFDFFDEQIKSLLSARMKILHLQYSWKKFMEQKKDEAH